MLDIILDIYNSNTLLNFDNLLVKLNTLNTINFQPLHLEATSIKWKSLLLPFLTTTFIYKK